MNGMMNWISALSSRLWQCVVLWVWVGHRAFLAFPVVVLYARCHMREKGRKKKTPTCHRACIAVVAAVTRWWCDVISDMICKNMVSYCSQCAYLLHFIDLNWSPSFHFFLLILMHMSSRHYAFHTKCTYNYSPCVCVWERERLKEETKSDKKCMTYSHKIL